MGVDPWALANFSTDSLPAVWTSDLEGEAELHHRLLLATLELEALQSSVKEERWKSEENISQLIQMLKETTQERDEAREQLRVLLNRVAHLQPDDSPQIWPARGYSGVVESESLNGLPRQPLFLEKNHSFSVAAGFDRGDAIIESISSKKPLPEKGKLLETLLKMGPMLDTLMVAGPLPRWRNPPPLQSFQISPATVGARHARLLDRAAVLSSDNLSWGSPGEESNGLSRMHAASNAGIL